MKRKAYTPKTKVAEDHCALCGDVLESIMISEKKRFKVTANYTSGNLCPSCEERVAVAVKEMEKGGCLVMCKSCDAVGYLPHGQAPENVDVLITTCPACQKSQSSR